MEGSDIVDAARKYIGTPFRHQGRLPGVALDCAGLFIQICLDLGFSPVDSKGYGRNPYKGMLETHADNQEFMRRIPISEMAAGDILLMRFSGNPQHVAIHAGENIIHAYEHAGKVVEHRMADVWRARVVRAYRLADIE